MLFHVILWKNMKEHDRTWYFVISDLLVAIQEILAGSL